MRRLLGHAISAILCYQVLMMENSLVRRAMALAWFTIGYNLLEGAVSISFGVNDDSVALAGFGVDSLIEVASAILVLWRFRGEAGIGSDLSISRERTATLGIGVLFMFLAVMTALASFLQLRTLSHPATSIPGVVISAISLSFMFWLWSAKKSLGLQLDSATIMKDAACSLACIKLSMVLFAGSLLYALVPSFWWSDSVAALFLSVLIGKEGWETVQAARSPEFSGGCGCSCGH